jgi:hypothetical protein
MTSHRTMLVLLDEIERALLESRSVRALFRVLEARVIAHAHRSHAGMLHVLAVLQVVPPDDLRFRRGLATLRSAITAHARDEEALVFGHARRVLSAWEEEAIAECMRGDAPAPQDKAASLDPAWDDAPKPLRRVH